MLVVIPQRESKSMRRRHIFSLLDHRILSILWLDFGQWNGIGHGSCKIKKIKLVMTPLRLPSEKFARETLMKLKEKLKDRM